MAECQECKTVIRKGVVVSKCGARLNDAKTIDIKTEKKKSKPKKEVLKKSENKIFDDFDETYINEEENNE